MNLDVVRRGFLKAANDYEYITWKWRYHFCPLCFDERKIQLEDGIREFELSSILVADGGLKYNKQCCVLTAEYMKAHSFQSKVLFLTITIPEILWKRIILLCQYMTGLYSYCKSTG